MSDTSTLLGARLAELRDRIPNTARGVIDDFTSLERYLERTWDNEAISDSLRQAILNKLERILKSPEKYLLGEQVPTLYDLVGLREDAVQQEPWPVRVPRRLLEDAFSTLIRRTNDASSCRGRWTEVQESRFYRQWKDYAPWAQVECIGYTISRASSVLRTRNQIRAKGVTRMASNSDDARRVRNECPKLENYRKIVQHGDPVSFHQILAESSARSSTSGTLFDKPPQEFQPSPRSPNPAVSHTDRRSGSPHSRSRTRSRSPPRQSRSPPQQSRIRSPFRAKARSNIDENRADSQRSPRIESPSPNRAISPVHDSTHSEPVEQATPKSESEREEWESWLNFD